MSRFDQDNLVYDLADRSACGVGFIANIQGKKSHALLDQSIQALQRLAHRGAIDADGKTGDGAGVLTQVPHSFFTKAAKQQKWKLPEAGQYGVGMIFFPKDKKAVKECRRIIEDILASHGIPLIGWRQVPIDDSCLGEKAISIQPHIEQLFVGQCPKREAASFEKELYLIRKEIEIIALEHSFDDFYIPSFSSKTIVYKGLFVGGQVRDFYLDLQDPTFETAMVVFHQRYSTNTFPNWMLAQPFRMVAHNGEINTIQGNRNWMYARERAEQAARSWVSQDFALKKILMAARSDSATFDNALEAIYHGGKSMTHAAVQMIPEAWEKNKEMSEELKGFFEFNACLGEPWDGPAAITFSDGTIVGGILDRNGLRPARYTVTKDVMALCSEVGIIDFDEKEVVEKGRLSPGRIIAVDLEKKRVLKDLEIKEELADRNPYLEWTKKHVFDLDRSLEEKNVSRIVTKKTFDDEKRIRFQKVFGYTQEDLDLILKPMVMDSKEPVGSMGDDTPLSVLSNKPRLLYTYFKQLFAQVTNPPIDFIREELVMTLRMYLGDSINIFEETSERARKLKVESPILTAPVFEAIKNNKLFPAVVLSAQMKVSKGPNGIEDSLNHLCLAAEQAVDKGKVLLIISDRDVDDHYAPLPMLLAVAAVHHHLIRRGKRLNVSLIAETGEAREVHHFACLHGYGASLVYPYLTYEVLLAMADKGHFPGVTKDQVIKNYIKACEKGILKIMSKMGISTLASYHGAQIFEAIGLDISVVNTHFYGTFSRLSGVDLPLLAKDTLFRHQKAFTEDPEKIFDIGGFYRFRRQGEFHGFNPAVIRTLHKFVKSGEYEDYKDYTKAVREHPPASLRDFFDIKKVRKPISIDEVEPVEAIIHRFNTPGISHGAISRETHETFAIAMNRIGAKSDSGEGGEDVNRFKSLPNGDSKNSAIKQVASGRFGVTIEYLANSKELEIKIAQGAKPGEGGQLPGHKVSSEIARIRHSTPGVTLISPPPHHDIYSIEDLAQLIYDLKQANPRARVCVKLVAEAGVGTIAAGVAKAHADTILISGHDGGTGASPLSSIKHAGLPWELGIAETQQVLVYNNLRDRITLRSDGGFKTAHDVIMAALLGAEEYGFGTASMVAAGCVMVRQCHLNTCPVGVATQDPKLRARYTGTPEKVVNFFTSVAQEVREILAGLGYRKLDEIIGHSELLKLKKLEPNEKRDMLNFNPILAPADKTGKKPLRRMVERNDWVDDLPLDLELIKQAKKVIETGKGNLKLKHSIKNTHRSVGTQLSYEVVTRHGREGLPNGSIKISLKGTAGQSFGAFAIKSVQLELEGECNDYVGKGLCGGELIIYPHREASFDAHENIIMGNTCLYGATSGYLFAHGIAGERFGVRNSGANAVVEGLGEHGCEYMTGGTIVVLGEVGRNFGAGMTGGRAFIFDEKENFKIRYNPDDILADPLPLNGSEEKDLKELIQSHADKTGSAVAQKIIKNWNKEREKFLLITPIELAQRQKLTKEEGESVEAYPFPAKQEAEAAQN